MKPVPPWGGGKGGGGGKGRMTMLLSTNQVVFLWTTFPRNKEDSSHHSWKYYTGGIVTPFGINPGWRQMKSTTWKKKKKKQPRRDKLASPSTVRETMDDPHRGGLAECPSEASSISRRHYSRRAWEWVASFKKGTSMRTDGQTDEHSEVMMCFYLHICKEA